MAITRLFVFLFALAIVNSKQDFSQRVTNFSFELLFFTSLETDQHTVISPYGIWTLMAAVSQGTGGRSYEQLVRALYLPKGQKELFSGYKFVSQEVHTKSKGITLEENNFIFADKNFQINQNFKKTVRTNFDAYVVPVDFKNPQESSLKVNELISKTTHGQIKESLYPEDFNDARVILTNVIHFKGLWKMPFNTSDTKIEPFENEKGQQIGYVNMMYQRAPFPFSNMKSLQAHVLEVPYGEENKFSMLIILPSGQNNILETFKKFQSVSINDIFDSLARDQEMFGEEDVDFSLPRFKISTNVVLNKPLNYMGIYDIFDPVSANFEQLTSEQVFVSKVVHKAEIEVTESGTVASAVTSSVISNRNPPVDFKVNRPFIYLVVSKTSHVVIFAGIYSKPSVF